MKVGVPTEIKDDEYRVALTAVGARELAEHGHDVLIQSGSRRGQRDHRRRLRGPGRDDRPDRRGRLGRGRPAAQGQGAAARRGRDAAGRDDALHLPAPGAGAGADQGPLRDAAPPASPTRRSRTANGRLPLLAPMSEIAGKIATQAGAFFLEKPLGGRGILLGGVPGRGGRERDGDRRRRGRPQRRPHRDRDGGRRASSSTSTSTRLRELDVQPSPAAARPSSARPSRSRRCCRGPTW